MQMLLLILSTVISILYWKESQPVVHEEAAGSTGAARGGSGFSRWCTRRQQVQPVVHEEASGSAGVARVSSSIQPLLHE